MASWIPAYRLVEGPEQTGIPFRYRGVRETDGAAAWIRVDGSDAASRRATDAVARIYAATARFDHPLLPRVLDYGSTSVAGRPFISFQASEPAAGGGRWTLRGMFVALAELQIAALECGWAGIHLPLHELLHLRGGERVERRHLPVREFLCEPRSADGRNGLACLASGAEAEPFLPPEVRYGSKGAPLRPTLSFRMAAQLHVLLEGRLREDDAPDPDAKTIALPAVGRHPVPIPASDVPRELVRLGLSLRPQDRPDPEQFLTLRLPPLQTP
ncbi:MAG: hypothetical protein ACM3JH_13980 [Acidithiobacillales bacterium]